MRTLLLLFVGLTGALGSKLSSCNGDACWIPPAAVLPPNEGTTEREATTILCTSSCGRVHSQTNSSSCVSDCTNQTIGSASPPSSPPNVSLSLREGVFTVVVCQEVKNTTYLIRVQDRFGNETYFPMTSCIRDISLLEFACSEVSISYAAVTVDSLSGYSSPQKLCVLLPPGNPDAASNLTVEFEEDQRSGFARRAILTLSWDSPSSKQLITGQLHLKSGVRIMLFSPTLDTDHLRVENHQLIIELNSINDDCMAQEPLNVTLNRGLTSYTIEPNKTFPSILLLYDCSYAATLVSFPGEANTSMQFLIEYTNRDREKLLITCFATYNPEKVVYNVHAQWNITNNLVLEIIQSYLVVLGFPRLFIFTKAFISEINSTQMFTYPEDPRTRAYHYTLTVETNRSGFKWRKRLIPGATTCDFILQPPPPPTPVLSDSIAVEGKIYEPGIRRLQFTVSWEPPTYLNGNLSLYQLCFGQQEVVGDQEECSLPSSRLCLLAPGTVSTDSTCQELQFSSSGLPVRTIQYSLDGNTTEVIIQVRAQNNYELLGNWSEAVVVNATPPVANGKSSPGLPQWGYGVIVAVIVLLLLPLIIVGLVAVYRRYCFHRGVKMGETLFEINNDRGFHLNQVPGFVPVLDKWELKRDDVQLLLDKPLGKGAFGEVYKGLLPPKVLSQMSNLSKLPGRKGTVNCVVAVKMLKDNTVVSEKANFLKEIEMMKSVSGTDNPLRQFVVNMMGCVTMEEPMMLVLEFITHGDLLSYLRAIRKRIAARFFGPGRRVDESDAVPYLEPSGVYSHLNPKDEDYDQLGTLEERDLVDFARQIAAGMEYLSSSDIVHRDLACRNILVGEGKALKVSDFGMSRLLPPDEVYVPTSHGLLPLRWMAIEALFYRHFTTKTDVWSFGVLLWEICTMGGFPYPSLSNRDLPELLRSGYRMDKPETCSQEVYEVMLNCWNMEPEERPNFLELNKTFDSFLHKQTQDKYPYMEVLSKPYHHDTVKPAPTESLVVVNLDIEVTDTDVGNEDSIRASRVLKSISYNEFGSLQVKSSLSHQSLRSLTNRESLNLAGTPTGSIHSLHAELIRQISWGQNLDETGGEVVLVNDRYVDEPSNTGVSEPNTHNQSTILSS